MAKTSYIAAALFTSMLALEGNGIADESITVCAEDSKTAYLEGRAKGASAAKLADSIKNLRYKIADLEGINEAHAQSILKARFATYATRKDLDCNGLDISKPLRACSKSF